VRVLWMQVIVWQEREWMQGEGEGPCVLSCPKMNALVPFAWLPVRICNSNQGCHKRRPSRHSIASARKPSDIQPILGKVLVRKLNTQNWIYFSNQIIVSKNILIHKNWIIMPYFNILLNLTFYILLINNCVNLFLLNE